MVLFLPAFARTVSEHATKMNLLASSKIKLHFPVLAGPPTHREATASQQTGRIPVQNFPLYREKIYGCQLMFHMDSSAKKISNALDRNFGQPLTSTFLVWPTLAEII